MWAKHSAAGCVCVCVLKNADSWTLPWIQWIKNPGCAIHESINTDYRLKTPCVVLKQHSIHYTKFLSGMSSAIHSESFCQDYRVSKEREIKKVGKPARQ